MKTMMKKPMMDKVDGAYEKRDAKMDKKMGIKEDSKKDVSMDRASNSYKEPDLKMDKKLGVKEDSKKDKAMDMRAMIKEHLAYGKK